uniref:Replisome organizer n=1 Tax=Myoviridae sp. ct1ba2 TaxID=2827654 RepID=A0A8S5S656_9CAUD|nr:MAG TPA: replisome organizer [Myoviridae sp. ct1ba2]
MAYGWISIHRKIQQSDIWLDKEPFDKRSAWIDLIMMANHEDKQILFNGKFIEVKRGEKITSLKQLSDRWRWSTGKVKRFLNLLESGSMIELKTKRRYTSYKVVNYNIYQNEDIDKRNEVETKSKRSRNEDETKTETNNNINNELIMNNNTTGVVPSPEEMDLDNPKLAKLIKLYQDCGFGLITPYSANMLRDYMNEYSYEWVKEAIEIAEQNGVRTLAYIRGVLNKKKTGVDKPRSFNKKQTYYRPKQDDELSKKSRNLNNKIISNFIEKMKKEEVINGETKQV